MGAGRHAAAAAALRVGAVEAEFLDYHFESYYKVTQAFTGTMVGQVGLTYLFLRRNARGRGDEPSSSSAPSP